MGRDKQQRGNSLKLGAVVKALMLCFFLGGSGLGYVWQKNEIHQLGGEFKAAEQALEKVRTENKRLAVQWNALRSPSFLESRIRELNLELRQPQPQQIVRLREPGILETRAEANTRLARNPDSTWLRSP